MLWVWGQDVWPVFTADITAVVCCSCLYRRHIGSGDIGFAPDKLLPARSCSLEIGFIAEEKFQARTLTKLKQFKTICSKKDMMAPPRDKNAGGATDLT